MNKCYCDKEATVFHVNNDHIVCRCEEHRWEYSVTYASVEEAQLELIQRKLYGEETESKVSGQILRKAS